MNKLAKTLRFMLYAAPVALTFNDCCVTCSTVRGASMQPTFNPQSSRGSRLQDVVLLSTWRAWTKPVPCRGDIVVYTSPRNPYQLVVKRVIGLPGDVVQTLQYKEQYVTVPDGHCWVEGDNHGQSEDSNKYGPVALGLIMAHATHIIFPPHRMCRLSNIIPEGREPLAIGYNHEDHLTS